MKIPLNFLKSLSLRSRQTGEKIKQRERYEFAEIPVSNVKDTTDYEVPVKVGHNAASEYYSHIHR